MEKKINLCCEGCWKWQKFGKECNVYWDSKKVCTLKEYLEGEGLF